MLTIYVGTRFLSLIPLDEILLQSVLGKNIRRHQPFDHDEAVNLSINNPRSIRDQSTQNVLAHWLPRFIVDAMMDLVLGDVPKAHTITCKDPESMLAPSLTSHLEKEYGMKPKQRDHLGQTWNGEFRHIIEEEKLGEELRDFINIPPTTHNKEYYDKFEHNFKLALQVSPHVIQERINRASKYPEQNLAQKYARNKK